MLAKEAHVLFHNTHFEKPQAFLNYLFLVTIKLLGAFINSQLTFSYNQLSSTRTCSVFVCFLALG